jgi:DNA-binding SARP family transcriptional activator
MTSKWAQAREHAREAAAVAAQAELGSLLPLARFIEAEAYAGVGGAKEALGALREAAATVTAWRSGPGQARCALLEVRLLGRRCPDRLVTRAMALAVRHRADLIGWLRQSASWIAPLLARRLGRDGVDALLVDLGDGAAPALVDALDDPRRRLAAIDALARLGDARARRPLQRWARHGDAAVRLAVSAALTAIGQPGPPALEVRLFGRFEIRRDGRLVEEAEWTTKKARSLVKLLLLHRPGGLHDEQLVEWLWPDHDAARGANSLKTALKLGRRALEPWLEGAASHFLQRVSQVLSFENAGAWIDLDEHTRLVAEARRAIAAGRIDEAIVRLGEAVALYRGDLLDPEDRYETWAESAREHWRQSHLEALVELSHLRASRGDYEPAATIMRAVVTPDPLRETAYRDLMRYALLRGRRDEAMAIYRRAPTPWSTGSAWPPSRPHAGCSTTCSARPDGFTTRRFRFTGISPPGCYERRKRRGGVSCSQVGTGRLVEQQRCW